MYHFILDLLIVGLAVSTVFILVGIWKIGNGQ